MPIHSPHDAGQRTQRAVSDSETALADPLSRGRPDTSGNSQVLVGFERWKRYRAVVIMTVRATKRRQSLAAENPGAMAGQTSEPLLPTWFAVEKGAQHPTGAASLPVSVSQPGGGVQQRGDRFAHETAPRLVPTARSR